MAKPVPRTLNMVPVGGGAYAYQPPRMLPSLVTRGKQGAKTAARKIGALAVEKKTEIGMLAGAGALGLLERFNVNLPFQLPVLGRNGTIGALVWGAGKLMKNATLRRAGFGIFCIALYNFAAKGNADG